MDQMECSILMAATASLWLWRLWWYCVGMGVLQAKPAISDRKGGW